MITDNLLINIHLCSLDPSNHCLQESDLEISMKAKNKAAKPTGWSIMTKGTWKVTTKGFNYNFLFLSPFKFSHSLLKAKINFRIFVKSKNIRQLKIYCWCSASGNEQPFIRKWRFFPQSVSFFHVAYSSEVSFMLRDTRISNFWKTNKRSISCRKILFTKCKRKLRVTCTGSRE